MLMRHATDYGSLFAGNLGLFPSI